MHKIALLLILAFVVAGCDALTPEPSTMEDSPKKTQEAPAKTAQADMPLGERMATVEAIIHEMPKDGMNQVMAAFTDLEMTKELTKDDPMNISEGMSEEAWMYSAKDDVTVVVCKALNTPAYMFQGKEMSEAELLKAKTMMSQMMDMMEGDHSMMEKEAMTDDGNKDMSDTMHDNVMTNEATYLAYTPEKLAQAKGQKPVVLFFHAQWCPTCVRWEKNVNENLSSLPANTLILQADYDTEGGLKKEYDIRSQSTAVFIDAQGNAVKTVIDPSLEEVSEHFSS